MIGMIEFMRDPTKGAAAFERAIAEHPTDTQLYVSYANSYLTLDRFKEAISVIDRGVAAGADASNLLDVKARCIERDESSDAAVQFLEAELRRTPSEKLYVAIVEIHDRRKNKEDVSLSLIQALRAFPKNEVLLKRYGQLLQESGNFINAARIYRQLIALNDSESAYHALLGNAYLSLNLNSLALSAYRRADELTEAKAAQSRGADRGRVRQHQPGGREQIQNPIHEHGGRADGSDGGVRILHDGDAGAKDVRERAPGAGAEVAVVASVPAVPGRRSHGQDNRHHRHRTNWTGDDQEVLGVRHEHAVLRPGVSQRRIHRWNPGS